MATFSDFFIVTNASAAGMKLLTRDTGSRLIQMYCSHRRQR